MTQKEIHILLKDLATRLPYGVKCNIAGLGNHTLYGIQYYKDKFYINVGYDACGNPKEFRVSLIRPYLRPMSSMTSAEKSELELMGFRYENGSIINEDVTEYDDYRNHPYTWVDETKCFEIIEFLNSHHFDYMGLIEKGLALEAPSDMYE